MVNNNIDFIFLNLINMTLNSSKLDSYGKFKIAEQKKFKNNVWTSYSIINIIKDYIKNNNLKFKTALDPCAGSCRLLKEFSEYKWQAYEINNEIINECIEEQFKQFVQEADFLKVDTIAHYDLCICNPPYNKNGGINKWVDKILNCCSYLFLIVPYNMIKQIKKQNYLIDVLHTDVDDMDKNYHTSIKIYIFKNEPQPKNLICENPLFYLNKHIKKQHDEIVIYLRDYLEYIDIKTSAKIKISDIEEGSLYPVYTLANSPIKYTDTFNCSENIVLVNHSYLASCKPLKYTMSKCYLNDKFLCYTIKEDKKTEFIKYFAEINDYLINLFNLNNCNVMIDKNDILNIPVFVKKDSTNLFNVHFNEYIKKFMYHDFIKNINVEWIV